MAAKDKSSSIYVLYMCIIFRFSMGGGFPPFVFVFHNICKKFNILPWTFCWEYRSMFSKSFVYLIMCEYEKIQYVLVQIERMFNV